jgi:hypothetical protein
MEKIEAMIMFYLKNTGCNIADNRNIDDVGDIMLGYV